MTTRHEIATVEDLERILDENPEIRERIRRKLLTEEERALPGIVAQLAEDLRRLTQVVTEGFARIDRELEVLREGQQRLEEGQQQLQEKQQRLEGGQQQLREGQERLEGGQQQLREGQERLFNSHENMRGLLLEQTAARRLFPRIAHQYRLRRARVVKSLDISMPADLMDTLDEAEAAGRITEEMATAIGVSDLIMWGISRIDASPMYVLAEVSGTLNRHDIARAQERAAALQAATGQRAMPVAAAMVIPEPQEAQASDVGVTTYLLS